MNLIQTDERERVVERKEVPLFDNKAFREAVINAVLHNKWVEGNEPMISVFSDRIEILSRGTIPPAQTMEGFFLGESIPVNEKLSEIFLQLHISEKSGRGVPKIIEVYGKDAFTFRENSIVVTIPFQRIHNPQIALGNKTGDKKPLNERRRKIITEMRNDPNITTAQLRVILGCAETTVENNISYLRKNGYIERAMDKNEVKSKKISTSELWAKLFRSASVERYLAGSVDMQELPLFSEYISMLAEERNEKAEAVIRRGEIESSFGHKLFSGTRNPSRDTVLQLAFGFELNADETQQLLKVARATALHPRVKRDAVIAYCLQYHRTFMETQQLLYDNHLPLIGGKHDRS